jgi:hypothetical protein
MKLLNINRTILLLVIGAFYFVSCIDVPEDIVLPEWDVELNVPLINKSYTLKEIIKEQKHISIDTTDGKDIFLLQSGKYFLNRSLSEFMQINETSSLENVPTITSQTDSFIVYVRFPEGLEVDKGEFETGVMNLSVSNPSSENTSVVLRIPSFYDFQGNCITIQTSVAPGESNSVDYDIGGYRYEKPIDQPDDLRNSFRVVAKAYSEHSGNVVYTDLSMSKLSFKSVTGVMPSKSLGNQVSTYDFDIDNVEEYRDKTYLSEAKLNLRANYLSMFNTPNELDVRNLNIIGRRNDGSEFYLRDKTNNANFSIRLMNGSHNGAYTEINSNIIEFMTFLPDSVVLHAEYVVNPENNNGTFSNLDSIVFETDFSTKSYLALENTVVEDQTPVELSKQERDDITNGKAADIKLEIENAVPLKAWLKIDLLDENNNYLFTLTGDSETGDSISFMGASVDGNGEAQEPFLNPAKTITLNESQVLLFSKASYINYRVGFSTKDSHLDPPTIVAVRPSNWINLKVFGKVTYRISLND